MWKNPVPAGTAFWKIPADEALGLLGSAKEGLKEYQVAERFHPGKKTNPLVRELRLFFLRFADPLMMLLTAAGFLSLALGERTDAFIIFFILMASAFTAWMLHSRAGRLLLKLQAMVVPDSGVIREGKYRRIPSESVVPGDILQLQAGDVLPADCLLLEANELHANESGFTGESYPARKRPGIYPEDCPLKNRKNCLWKGSNLVSGSGLALAVHCGDQAVFGEMMRELAETRQSGFEKGLREFGFFLLRITLLLSLILLVLNFIRHRGLIESALFSLALAVGMAPELLPAITTMAMSQGAARMLEKEVIVKDINSIQNLGEISLLCTDKTGTLTEGSIRAEGFKNTEGREDPLVKELACINACLSSGYANPMEEALRKLALPLPDSALKTGEVPYDFIRKRVSISIKTGNAYRMICKGSFRTVLPVCSSVLCEDGRREPMEKHIQRLENSYLQYGGAGLRCLLVAFRDMNTGEVHKADEQDLTLCGFVLFHDPVKAGVKQALDQLHDLKVGLKILSGDSRPVLQALAEKIGMKDREILTGEELDRTGAEALRHLLSTTSLFAELEPRHKERIIQSLRKRHVLAYMGDGINDVTALHAADVGISVNNAAGIAIEASDFVLLRKDISVLADGIREGRRTFANTLKYIYISTGSTFGNMFSVAIASLFLPFIPMLPRQILITNFISDFPFLSVAADSVDEEQLLTPGKWKMSLVRDFMLVFGLHSTLFDLITFSFLYFGMKAGETDFRTGWFTESVITEILIIFVVRTRRPFFKSKPALPLLLPGLAAILLTLAIPWLPMADQIGLSEQGAGMMTGLLLILLAYFLSADILKQWFFKFHRPL